jgi:hypothetical protein
MRAGTKAGRRTAAAVAVAAIAAGAAAPGAGAAVQPRVASATMAYEADYSYTKDSTIVPSGGPCAGTRGTLAYAQTMALRKRYPIKLIQTGRGWDVHPARTNNSGRVAFPVTGTFRQVATQNVEELRADETADGGCRPTGWFAASTNGTRTDACGYRGGLIVDPQRRGGILAAFAMDGSQRCREISDQDGYPGTTNYFPHATPFSSRALGTQRRTVISLTRTKTKRGSERYNDGTENWTEVDRMRWKLTIVRTSGWRPWRG